MVREYTILVADDDEHEHALLEAAYEGAESRAHLMFVGDGKEALEYLSGHGAFADRSKNPFPDLLLLDIKMPNMDGFEVLEWLRQQKGIGRLPVIMRSSSTAEADVIRARELGATGYMVKVCGLEKMTEAARAIDLFWVRQNRYPRLQRNPRALVQT